MTFIKITVLRLHSLFVRHTFLSPFHAYLPSYNPPGSELNHRHVNQMPAAHSKKRYSIFLEKMRLKQSLLHRKMSNAQKCNLEN